MDSDSGALPEFKLPPAWKVKALAIACAGAALTSLTPVAETIWEWLRDPYDKSIAWKQLTRLFIACAGPAILAEYRRHRAWLKAPPGTELVKTTSTVTSSPGEPPVVSVEKQTLDVVPKERPPQ